MPPDSYNNIIFILTSIILEFMSARFVYPGAQLPFYLFNTIWNIRITILVNF